jgi:hypothetical protein
MRRRRLASIPDNRKSDAKFRNLGSNEVAA